MTEIFLQNQVIQLLKTITDPEVGINIWDFGLIYGVLVKELPNNSKLVSKNFQQKKDIKNPETENNEKLRDFENKTEIKNLAKDSQKNLNFTDNLNCSPEFSCHILMTFTSVNCPAIDSLPMEIKEKITKLGFFFQIEIEIVWEPKWEITLLSEEIQFELGLL